MKSNKGSGRRKKVKELEEKDYCEIQNNTEDSSVISDEQNVVVPTIKGVSNNSAEVKGIFNDIVQTEENGGYEVVRADDYEAKIDAIRGVLLGKIMEMVEGMDYRTMKDPDRFVSNIANSLLRLSNLAHSTDVAMDGMAKILQRFTGRPFVQFKKKNG